MIFLMIFSIAKTLRLSIKRFLLNAITRVKSGRLTGYIRNTLQKSAELIMRQPVSRIPYQMKWRMSWSRVCCGVFSMAV
jgi:hypothetical protein